MFDALAAHLSLAIDRHRTRDRLETLSTQLLSIAKLMAFESASVGIVHELNHSMTDYLLKLDKVTRNPEIRCNKGGDRLPRSHKEIRKGWYESARDNLRRFHEEQVKTDIPIDELAKEVVEKWQKKAADRHCKLRGEYGTIRRD